MPLFYLLDSSYESSQEHENEESENEGAMLTDTGIGSSK